MSLCLDSNNVLANQVSTTSTIQISEKPVTENTPILASSTTPISGPVDLNDTQHQLLHKKTVTKLLVSNHQTSMVGNVTPVLQKISNPPVITVLNSTGGPLTVLKTICVTSGVSSAPHFSLVNNQSLSVTNAVGKTPTITLLNTPVTVVKMTPPHTQNVDKPLENINCPVSMQNVSTIIENRAHNVFVKNTCSDSTVSDVPQGHKFLTANNFSQTNVLTNNPTSSGKSVNSQRSKLKILGNVVVPSVTSTSNNQQITTQLISKQNAHPQQQQQQRLVPRQKVLGPHGGQSKYINKLQNTGQQKSLCTLKQNLEKVQPQAKVMYPTHKSQIKTLPPVNNYMPKPNMKTLNSHQPKNIPAQIQRTGSGLRTIPPQRPPKLPNKLNYIGKHAVQAQKVKHGQNRLKPLKQGNLAFYGSCIPQSHPNKQLAFNQALTAEILETLGNKSGPNTSYQNKNYEILPNRYITPGYAEEQEPEPLKCEDKSKSGLDALSLICQAVLLDHNYNATLPPDSPTKIGPLTNNSLQANGMTGNSMLIYSPGSSSKSKYPPERKRTPSCSNPVSASSSLSNISLSLPSNSTSLVNLQDDDAASDISDCSDRKHDTEGEETDTAPEAEAVNNEELYEHYGDYVTRCICGFLHDDGYMVECDQCKVWQHVQCVVKNKQVPDEYLCERCNPSKPVDPHKARMIQQQWIRERQLPDMKTFKKDIRMKENPKTKEIPSDSDSSDAENPRNNNNTVITKGRTPLAQRKKSDKQLTKQKKDLKEANMQRRSFKKRERKLIRRKSKLQTKKDEDDNRDTVVVPQLPQLRQWIENYEEAVTNHYSPELRARISNIRVNGSQNIDTSVGFDPLVNKCSVHTLPLTDLKYLVATEDISPDSSIIELRGKYMLSIQHRNTGGNLNTRQHAQRPGPFLFFYRLNKDNTEVCVDTRTYGNVARFVRRSCKPNAELRHCIEKGVLHLYIVAISQIEKCSEITIKHESHDLAAIGTTQISCYCGNSTECNVNKSTVKKNGDSVTEMHRKKRGRRTTSVSLPTEPDIPVISIKGEAQSCEHLPTPIPSIIPCSPSPIKVKTEQREIEVKHEMKIEKSTEVKEELLDITEIKIDLDAIKEERPSTPVEVMSELAEPSEIDEKDMKKEETENECKKSPVSVSTRRTSQHKLEKDKDDEKPSKQEKSKNKKLSREERKLQAILRAIEQMEKANQRKQEHKQIKHVQRRESEPSSYSKDEEKAIDLKQKRKRKGRARTTSTYSTRRDRLNSGDSYFTSGDENMLSPNEGIHPKKTEETTDESASGKHDQYLLAFSSNDETNQEDKSPPRENDSNSNSAHSSPETPLSLACSLVQAAVEPLEPGFKFPKTKKGMMNEWLNKTPEPVVPTTSNLLSVHINNLEVETITNVGTPSKSISNESGPKGSAKKRWLRQAISEDKCDSPQESPPISDMVAPPKKRRLPRESISNDITPPTTPTSLIPPENRLDFDPSVTSQEIRSFQLMYEDSSDNRKEILESDVSKEGVADMKQEFSKSLMQSATSELNQRPDTLPLGCIMDPRLRNHNFSSSEHLVGTVEKTLSILGFEERKPEIVPPAKRKLSITEYRQRKKLNNNEVNDKSDETISTEDCVNEENNSSESFQMMSTRPRLNSPSSSSSSSSDDEAPMITELPSKVPAFNSEPTELERQREMQSLRLKKAFGLSIDVEPKKPALTGDCVFKSELTTPPLIKSFTSHSSPSYSTTLNCEVPDLNKSTLNSPRLHAILTQTDPIASSPNIAEQERESSFEKSTGPSTPSLEVPSDDVITPSSPEKDILDGRNICELGKSMEFEEAHEEEKIEPHMFYTPDEEEIEEKDFPEIESISYVPPFNNPIYPSINYTSVIDEEGRYEGRNPSPPPHLESGDMET